MRYLFILLAFASLQASAQCKEFIVNAYGDTLNCVDKNGVKQGPWVVKVESVRGERGYEEEGYYHNGNKEGVWRRFSLEGDLIAMEQYRWGQKNGKNAYFNNMGQLMREESWRAVDPKNPFDTVNVYDVNDPSKVIAKQVVKMETLTVKHGTWKYYDPERGTVEETVNWYFDKPVAKEGDELAPLAVSDGEDGAAKPDPKKTKPKEVMQFEKQNSGKKKIKVRTGSTGG